MRNITYHKITSIQLTNIVHFQKSKDVGEFYTRSLVITMDDGSFECIGLYADTADALAPVETAPVTLKEAA